MTREEAITRLEAAEAHAREVFAITIAHGTAFPEPNLSLIDCGHWTIDVASDGEEYAYLAVPHCGQPKCGLDVCREDVITTIMRHCVEPAREEVSHGHV